MLDDNPEWKPDDFRAVYGFAVRMGRRAAPVRLLFDENLSHPVSSLIGVLTCRANRVVTKLIDW